MRRLLLTCALATAIAGCNAPEQQDTPQQRQQVIDAIRSAAAEVTVETVESRQPTVAGLRSEPELYIRVLGPAADPDQARARTRRIAKAAWFAAPHRLVSIVVQHKIPLVANGTCLATAGCWEDNLALPTDAAAALWGPAAGRDRPAYSSGQACAKSASATVPDLDQISPNATFSGTSFGGLNLAVEATIRTAPADKGALAAQFAHFVWRCHPGKIDSVEVRIKEATGAITGFQHSAATLRAEFGPRPPDLPS